MIANTLRFLIDEKPGNIFSYGNGHRVIISTAPTGSLVAISPTLVVIAPEAPRQMTLFGEMVVTQGGKRKKR